MNYTFFDALSHDYLSYLQFAYPNCAPDTNVISLDEFQVLWCRLNDLEPYQLYDPSDEVYSRFVRSRNMKKRIKFS